MSRKAIFHINYKLTDLFGVKRPPSAMRAIHTQRQFHVASKQTHTRALARIVGESLKAAKQLSGQLN